MASTVLITGANRGVGLALARHYQQAGWRVIGVCRRGSDELSEVASRVIDGIDVTREADVARLRQAGAAIPRTMLRSMWRSTARAAAGR